MLINKNMSSCVFGVQVGRIVKMKESEKIKK